jgi:hypothetical protein
MNIKNFKLINLLIIGVMLSSCNSGSGSFTNNTTHSISSVANSTLDSEFGDANILVIGIDGARADTIQNVIQQIRGEVNNQSGQQFIKFYDTSVANYHIYSGGRDWDASQQQVKSDPSWTTLFTGGYGYLTGVYENGKIPTNYNSSWPTMFNWFNYMHGDNGSEATKQVSNTIMLHDWHWDKELTVRPDIYGVNPRNADEVKFYPYDGSLNDLSRIQTSMTNDAAQRINTTLNNNPTMLWLHYDNPDHTGHKTDWSSNPDSDYGKAIHTLLSNDISKLISAVNFKRDTGQRWLIVINTDHGGHGGGHGDKVTTIDRWEDTQTFAILNDCMSDLNKQALYCSKSGNASENTAHLGAAYLMPTIMAYISNGRYTNIERLRNLPGLPLNLLHYWPDDKHLGSIYFRLNISNQTIDDGYPRPINAKYWDNIYSKLNNTNNYQAIYNDGNDNMFVLDKNGIVHTYNDDTHKVTSTNSFATLYPNIDIDYQQIKSAWYNGNKVIGFLANNQITFYNIKEKKIIWKTSSAFSEFSNSQIQFAVYAKSNQVDYFIKDSFGKIQVYQDNVDDSSVKLKYLGSLNDNQDIAGDLTGLQTYQNDLHQAAYHNGNIYFFTNNLVTDYY